MSKTIKSSVSQSDDDSKKRGQKEEGKEASRSGGTKARADKEPRRSGGQKRPPTGGTKARTDKEPDRTGGRKTGKKGCLSGVLGLLALVVGFLGLTLHRRAD